MKLFTAPFITDLGLFTVARLKRRIDAPHNGIEEPYRVPGPAPLTARRPCSSLT
jgi:hypothetical protein